MIVRAALFVHTVIGICGPSNAQQGDKGTFFVHWGYNRAWYSWSDIHFDGPDYDFTLRHVEAKDRPMPFGKDYFNPKNIWIPQYNYRAGWFFHDRWSVSLGLDHMKYVMVQDQTVRMDGYVNGTRSIQHATAEGSRDVRLTQDFLKYEHTDGLNLLSVDLDHYDRLWAGRNNTFRLNAYEGVHAGPVIPRSDVRLFGQGLNNRFNVAGVGVGAQAGFHVWLGKHVYIRNTLKAGWIDLTHVLTTGNDADHASQHFWFVQHAIVVGASFRIGGGGSADH
ncbi:MAG: hypothetical protein IPI81_02810 [Flavobacteriales bacterium]|nr:hypothetical protein [Flavobacteriales bacterium]MCC6937000.1 hypothetical protein [Flavobacteriales bacterium]